MDHLEAQSYIMPFIEGKVPSDKQGDFVLHMRNCSKCHEELEIYYTLLVGMRQLDNKENLSTDFNKDLEKELKAMSQHVSRRKSFKVSAFSIFMSVAIIVIAVLYAGSLSRIYSFEQKTKSKNQGTFYFSESIGDDLKIDIEDAVVRGQDIDNSEKISDFDRIEGYKRLESDYEAIIKLGEDLADVEATSD